MKKGNYLIRIKKKPVKKASLNSTSNAIDKIVITANSKLKFDYKQQNVCTYLFIIVAENFMSFLRAKGSKMLLDRGIKKFRD
mgnify:CR=1 FL=1